MAQPSAFKIHIFYRLFFTYLDPLICIWGAYMDFFDPALVLSSHVPNVSPDIGHAMILKQRGGGMLNFGFISAVLLRYSTDLQVWRIVQFADLIVDVAYFWAVWEGLGAQGRLDLGTWRAEDWGSLGITGCATAVRMAFLMEVGFGRRAGEKKIA
ncbi:uncharacterized protein BDR25DRAFT_301467 [Lindgomyces ingoldianus]|uniref:Uncharacterized protein n=1 Tax=Lindgomyces ingoldianus TaxID=673940 RepID=A0ACB6R6C9_9PLEO|nr:uncharacterized protein BDR25DRAFT_301467 [Lindgomyces ingoldianus]KAF2474858.1 hypothetical protein BDR25DRAFT_301467 [Lindgomyces ingoldianus]